MTISLELTYVTSTLNRLSHTCSNIVEQCRLIVADNGYSDVVEVIRGKMEEITLPVDYVDIIISEWMVREVNIICPVRFLPSNEEYLR